MSGQHSPVGPSGAARRNQCPASVQLAARYPEPEGPEAAEGECAHWVKQEMKEGRTPALGTPGPNGVVVTPEMIQGAELANDRMLLDLQPFGMTLDDVATEVPVSIQRVHPQAWGTPDDRAWVPSERRGPAHAGRPLLFLWDYKFGHEVVEVYENAQLIDYVAGIVPGVAYGGIPDEGIDVVLTIIQPRSFHRDGPIRVWKTSAVDLRAHINISSMKAHEALGPNPGASAGPECKHCPARHACPVLQREGYAAAAVARGVLPVDLPPAALGLELKVLTEARGLLNARISGIEQQVLALLKGGQSVPHWAVEHNLGRQVWAKPVAEVLMLGQAFNLDLAKPPEAITPKQAIEKGLDASLVTAYSNTPRGEAKLVADDGSKARRIFGGQS